MKQSRKQVPVARPEFFTGLVWAIILSIPVWGALIALLYLINN